MRKTLLLAPAVAALAAAMPARAVVIDFESVSPGFYDTGLYLSGVNFTDALGVGVEVDTGSSASQSLNVFDHDDGNFLIGVLDEPATSISFGFGGDFLNRTDEGDRATLRVLFGPTLVAEVFVELDRDGLFSQTITYDAGDPFTNFQFAYTNALGEPTTGANADQLGLVESIDAVIIETVPEPATCLALMAGFGALLAQKRRRI